MLIGVVAMPVTINQRRVGLPTLVPYCFNRFFEEISIARAARKVIGSSTIPVPAVAMSSIIVTVTVTKATVPTANAAPPAVLVKSSQILIFDCAREGALAGILHQ
ncbi:MAG: hypothetical protein ACJAUP_001655 [Cellvibrionaceae bacterium]|jgi:hypothetical protein